MPVDLSDLGLAKRTLSEEQLSLAVVKDGRILFKSKSHGVSDLIGMIREIDQVAAGASLADSIVGRAAALLCVYSTIASVYGVTMSEGVIPLFKASGVRFEYGVLVPKILNRDKSGMCPFEEAVLGIDSPSDALDKLSFLRFG